MGLFINILLHTAAKAEGGVFLAFCVLLAIERTQLDVRLYVLCRPVL